MYPDELEALKRLLGATLDAIGDTNQVVDKARRELKRLHMLRLALQTNIAAMEAESAIQDEEVLAAMTETILEKSRLEEKARLNRL